MSKVTELHDAVLSSLKESGKLKQLSAQIRAEIFHMLLKDQTQSESTPRCRENYIINELIREYLQFNGYSNSLSVFLRETGQPEDPMNRQFLAQSLNVVPHSQVPLLYSLTSRENRTNTQDSDDEPIMHQTVEEDTVHGFPSNGFFEIRSV